MSFDRSYLANPFSEYLKWILCKSRYQYKYRKSHLRISYNAIIKRCEFGKFNWVGPNCRVFDSHLNDYSYIAENGVVNKCRIGKFCSIGPNVNISPGRHPIHFVSTHPSTYNDPGPLMKNFSGNSKFTYPADVIIGNDVWIGANVVILNDIKIGNGAILGANSVITKDVKPYEIVGGVPAKVIKKRFKDAEIDLLLKTEWWDKSDEWIEKNISKFWSLRSFIDVNEYQEIINLNEIKEILNKFDISTGEKI